MTKDTIASAGFRSKFLPCIYHTSTSGVRIVLTICDLHQDLELSSCAMGEVSGGVTIDNLLNQGSSAAATEKTSSNIWDLAMPGHGKSSGKSSSNSWSVSLASVE
jgi:hypothetical protein